MMHILVADDGRWSSTTFIDSLTELDINVLLASGLSDIRNLLQSECPIDITLLDFSLEQEAPASILETIQRERPKSPILLTSHPRQDLSFEAMTALADLWGAIGVLQKPFSSKYELQKIKDILTA